MLRSGTAPGKAPSLPASARPKRLRREEESFKKRPNARQTLPVSLLPILHIENKYDAGLANVLRYFERQSYIVAASN